MIYGCIWVENARANDFPLHAHINTYIFTWPIGYTVTLIKSSQVNFTWISSSSNSKYCLRVQWGYHFMTAHKFKKKIVIIGIINHKIILLLKFMKIYKSILFLHGLLEENVRSVIQNIFLYQHISMEEDSPGGCHGNMIFFSFCFSI